MSMHIVYKIDGMECPNCAMILEGMEDRLSGIVQVEASYRKARMEVIFDEEKISEDQIQAEINRLGYAVVGSSFG